MHLVIYLMIYNIFILVVPFEMAMFRYAPKTGLTFVLAAFQALPDSFAHAQGARIAKQRWHLRCRVSLGRKVKKSALGMRMNA
jgi:hypothetical protein